jgi:hypothetical protein
MAPNLGRVAQAAFVAAILESASEVVRSHSFYPIAVALFVVYEFGDFFIVCWLAAYIATRKIFKAIWAQLIIFFGIVMAPSILLTVLFYRSTGGVGLYTQNGDVLISNGRVTTAGLHDLAISVMSSVVIGLVCTVIYFRRSVGIGVNR